MCGLVAVLNKNHNGFETVQNDVFSTLLFLDLLRGDDSTGIMHINVDGDVSIAKEATDSLAFMRSKEYESLRRKSFARGAALIGHNRKATRGIVNDENAHPFVVNDNIVLVHNGTLYGDHKKHADTEVDSHAIAHVIQKTGDVTKALNEIDGAYALIWYNVEEGSINIIRNKARPLWWMETPNSYIFCSEKGMLDFAADRHRLVIKQAPVELPENLLQTFTLGKHGGWASDSKEIKIETKTYQSSNTHHGGAWQFGSPTGGRSQQSRYYDEHCAYTGCGIEDDDDQAPFEAHPLARAAANTVPHSTVPLVQREVEMAKRANKWVSNKEYQKEILDRVHAGHKVMIECFDYIEAPFKDGFYIYGSVLDDPELVVRMWFAKAACSEERAIQIASTGYIYECTVGNIMWLPYEQRPGVEPYLPDDRGVVLLTSGRMELIYGGAMGSQEDVQKRMSKAH